MISTNKKAQSFTLKCISDMTISTHNTAQSFKVQANLAKWLSVRLRAK